MLRKPEEISDDEYSGMTVNERLYATGLIGEWDRAAMSRDRAGMIAILGRVAIREADATALVDAVLSNPANYGL